MSLIFVFNECVQNVLTLRRKIFSCCISYLVLAQLILCYTKIIFLPISYTARRTSFLFFQWLLEVSYYSLYAWSDLLVYRGAFMPSSLLYNWFTFLFSAMFSSLPVTVTIGVFFVIKLYLL